MSYEDKSEHTTGELIPLCELTPEAEILFGEYKTQRDLYERMILKGSDGADGMLPFVRSAALKLAEHIYMEREYAGFGKRWRET